MAETVYKRILLKLSGEALKSDHDLFDFNKVNEIARIIRQMREMNVEVGIVIGAGNIWRGRQGPSASMDAVTADQMGMLGTVINCLCVADALRREGVDAVVQSAVDMKLAILQGDMAAFARILGEAWEDKKKIDRKSVV